MTTYNPANHEPRPAQKCKYAPTVNTNFLYAQNAARCFEQNRDAFAEYMRMKTIPPRCPFVRGCEVPAAKR